MELLRIQKEKGKKEEEEERKGLNKDASFVTTGEAQRYFQYLLQIQGNAADL